MHGVNLQNTKLEFTKFHQASFDDSLKKADLDGATGSGFSYTNLEGFDFSGINLREVSFIGSWLHGSDFSHSNLDGVRFPLANLSNANFEGADLQKTLAYFLLTDKELSKISLSETYDRNEITSIIFPDRDNIFVTEIDYCRNLPDQPFLSRFTGLDIDSICVQTYIHNIFDRATLKNANFANAKIDFVVFISANLQYANFAGATGYVSFIGADLKYANLSGADLTGSDFSDANLTGVDMKNTILDDVNFDGAILKCKNHPVCVK